MRSAFSLKNFIIAALVISLVSMLFCAFFSFSFTDGVIESDPRPRVETSLWQLSSAEGSVPAPSGTVPTGGASEVVLTRTVQPNELDKQVLLFKNNRQSVYVAANEKVLFNLGNGHRRFGFTATGYCAVPLPVSDESYQLTVHFTNLTGESCKLPELSVGTADTVTSYLLRMDFYQLAFFPFAFFSVVLIIGLMVLSAQSLMHEKKFIAISMLLVFSTVFLFSELNCIALLNINREFLSIVSFYMLMLIPLTVVLYIKYSCSLVNQKTFRILAFTMTANIIIQSVLGAFGIVNFYRMLVVTHLLMILSAFFAVGSMFRQYKEEPLPVNLHNFAYMTTTGVVSIFVVLSFRLELNNTLLYRMGLQITLMLLLTGMLSETAITMKNRLTQSQIKDAEESAYRNISLKDQLTGAKNRRAYDLLMEEIDSKPEIYLDPGLILIDLDGFKYINDKFGPAAGDDVLISVSEILERVFGGIGSVYRIGGDDFAIVITALCSPEMLRAYCDKLDRLFIAYAEEKEMPLSFSKGMCMLCKGDERLSVSEWKTLANKDLYDHKVSKKNSGLGLADNYLELISSFVGAVDAKDSYTADHSQRVGDLTARICNMLGLSTGSAEIITMAARLHDIGKIGIPDAVLLKSGRLTEAEWEIMQKHTVLGEDIIKCIKPFYEVSQIVRHHHERVDGMGYPDGLAGDEIPLGARIVAIADSIDAMTSKRVYRDAMSTDTCREQIEKNLGKAYDKAIGEIVLNNWHQIEHIIEFRSTNRAGWIPPIHLHIAGSK